MVSLFAALGVLFGIMMILVYFLTPSEKPYEKAHKLRKMQQEANASAKRQAKDWGFEVRLPHPKIEQEDIELELKKEFYRINKFDFQNIFIKGHYSVPGEESWYEKYLAASDKSKFLKENDHPRKRKPYMEDNDLPF